MARHEKIHDREITRGQKTQLLQRIPAMCVSSLVNTNEKEQLNYIAPKPMSEAQYTKPPLSQDQDFTHYSITNQDNIHTTNGCFDPCELWPSVHLMNFRYPDIEEKNRSVIN
jgi:hypothetical protein